MRAKAGAKAFGFSEATCLCVNNRRRAYDVNQALVGRHPIGFVFCLYFVFKFVQLLVIVEMLEKPAAVLVFLHFSATAKRGPARLARSAEFCQ